MRMSIVDILLSSAMIKQKWYNKFVDGHMVE